MAWFGWWFGWFVGTSSEAAEPVFVPDFTPGSSEEFSATVMLQGMVVDRLLKDGDVVLTNNVVSSVLGPERINGCATRPGCPADVLPQLPARVAVVAKIERIGGTLVGSVALFQAGNPSPVESLYLPVAPGNEHLFAADVSTAVQALLGRLGPSPESTLAAAARLIAGQPMSTEAPQPGAPAPTGPAGTVTSPQPGIPVPRAPVGIKRYDGSTPHSGDLDAILEGTGISRRHMMGSEGAFRKSGLDPRDWMYRAMPHAGRVTFELRAGIGLGDVDRTGEVRVETEDGVQTNSWYQEGPAPGRRVLGGAYIGYAPVTMLDLGVLVGPQYGKRTLTTGSFAVSAGEILDERVNDPSELSALNLDIQPRVRTYLVPLGPAKPFLFTGLDLQVFNRYQIAQPANVTYPAPPGGVIPGWVGGGGMMIDPGPIVGFFAEGMYIRHFGELSELRQRSTEGPWTHPFEPIAETSGVTVGVTGGVQFRL